MLLNIDIYTDLCILSYIFWVSDLAKICLTSMCNTYYLSTHRLDYIMYTVSVYGLSGLEASARDVNNWIHL